MTSWLIDKSALVRLSTSADADLWATRIGRGLVRITTVTLLEVGFSAKSGPDLRDASRRPPLSMMPIECFTPTMEQRAVEVQMLLADQGQHRGPGIPDLLIAACAERAGCTVLHLDKDFELVADITAQPIERLRLH
jgi:predicted nucleic acid-binding protein